MSILEMFYSLHGTTEHLRFLKGLEGSAPKSDSQAQIEFFLIAASKGFITSSRVNNNQLKINSFKPQLLNILIKTNVFSTIRLAQ